MSKIPPIRRRDNNKNQVKNRIRRKFKSNNRISKLNRMAHFRIKVKFKAKIMKIIRNCEPIHMFLMLVNYDNLKKKVLKFSSLYID
jgi:hypothetical protein